jgi:hypothetical protein
MLAYPKTVRENLEFRQWLLASARGSRERREEIWIACRRDPLFFCGALLWTFDPRLTKGGGDPIVPFIPWPYQERALLTIDEAIDQQYPLCIQKTRDMGVTWKVLAAMMRRWLFFPMQKFLLASRVEDLVDARGDSDSLFWKVDFMLSMLPEWMKPEIERTGMHLHNVRNGSTFDGSSTNENLGRGGRRTAVMYDEFAAVQAAQEVHSASASLTDCPIYVSTHKGVGTKFYELSKSEMPKLTLHWTEHPKKAEGLYHDADGKPRSPWYDALGPVYGLTKSQIAGEVDINPEGSSESLYDESQLSKDEKDLVRAPIVGELEYDADKQQPLGWSDNPRGDFWRWGPEPTADREYVVGVDIAAGTGTSFSVICVGDCMTGEQVMEFASSRILPYDLAKLAIAVCKWFKGADGQGAFLIWESTGPTGSVFGQAVIEHGYGNVYFKTRDDDLNMAVSTKYGYGTSGATKEKMLGNLMQGMVSRRFLVRSSRVFREWRGYTYENGKVTYTGSKQSGDESNKGASHGDAVIAAGMAWHRMRIRMGRTPDEPMQRKVQPGTLAWRRREAEQEEREALHSEW